MVNIKKNKKQKNLILIFVVMLILIILFYFMYSFFFNTKKINNQDIENFEVEYGVTPDNQSCNEFNWRPVKTVAECQKGIDFLKNNWKQIANTIPGGYNNLGYVTVENSTSIPDPNNIKESNRGCYIRTSTIGNRYYYLPKTDKMNHSPHKRHQQICIIHDDNDSDSDDDEDNQCPENKTIIRSKKIRKKKIIGPPGPPGPPGPNVYEGKPNNYKLNEMNKVPQLKCKIKNINNNKYLDQNRRSKRLVII